MRNLTKTFFLTTLLAVGGLAIAGPGGGGGHGRGGHGPGHAFMKVVKDLDLSEDQQTRIRAIMEEARAERQADHEGRKAQMTAFKDALLSDAPDAAALHSMADDAHDARKAKLHDRIDDMIAVSAILTPAQRAEASARMDELREEHEARRAERGERGERGGRRGPRR